MSSELVFEVVSKLGKRIRISRRYWNRITTVKRPSLLGLEAEVKKSLTRPLEVRKSKKDPRVHLYYGRSKSDVDPLVCSVVKRLNGEGFIITVYQTRRMVGEVEWKSN